MTDMNTHTPINIGDKNSNKSEISNNENSHNDIVEQMSNKTKYTTAVDSDIVKNVDLESNNTIKRVTNEKNDQFNNTNSDQQNIDKCPLTVDQESNSVTEKEIPKIDSENANIQIDQQRKGICALQMTVDQESNAIERENSEIVKQNVNIQIDQQNTNISSIIMDVDQVSNSITEKEKPILGSQDANIKIDQQNKNISSIQMDVDQVSNSITEKEKHQKYSENDNIKIDQKNKTEATTKKVTSDGNALENQNNDKIQNDQQNNTELKDASNTNNNLGAKLNKDCSIQPNDLSQAMDIIEGNKTADTKQKDLEEDKLLEFEVPIKMENEEVGKVLEDNSEYPNVIILGSVVRKESGDKNRRRKCKKEIESLGIVRDEIERDEYDVFVDSNERLYKKYKLRDSRRPDYRIPTDILPPKPREETENEVREFPCRYCGLVLYNLGNLSKHLHSVHGQKFTCSLCSKNFESNLKLVSHKASHDFEDHSFICHECKLAFSSQYDYLIHGITHSTNETHKCVECNLTFGEDYAKHLATHFKPFITCDICSTAVQGRVNLLKHMKIHTGIEKGFQCVECLKVLSFKNEYEMHMSLHTGVKTYQCLYCGKAFRTKNQRSVHNRIHNNVRPFPCKMCDRAFKQRVDLQRHIAKSHTEAMLKKFQCNICSKIFTFKTDLDMHKRSQHNQDRLFPCPECESRYQTIGALRSHVMFKHTDSRPVECKLCNKRFINNNQFYKHSRSKTHKNNVFKIAIKKEQ